MKSFILSVVKNIHYTLPVWLQDLYLPLVLFFKRANMFLLPVHLISGKEPVTGQEIQICYLGRDAGSAYYFSNKFVQDASTTAVLRAVPVWSIKKYLKTEQAKSFDFALCETNSYTRCFFKNQRFIVPRWVEMKLCTRSAIRKTTGRYKKTHPKTCIRF
jgi:hypothetical protein